MVCLGFVILLEGIISLSSDGLHGYEQRASLLAHNSTPPAPYSETQGFQWVLQVCHSLLLSSLLAFICGCNFGCQGGAGVHEISWPTSNFIQSWDSRSTPVALPSSLSPAEAAAGRAWRMDNSWDPARLSGAAVASLMLLSIIQTIRALD